MRCFDKFVRFTKAHFGVGDFNLAVSTKSGSGHTVMTEISTPGVMQFLPALGYDDGELLEHCVSMCTLAVQNNATICVSCHVPMLISESSLSQSLAVSLICMHCKLSLIATPSWGRDTWSLTTTENCQITRLRLSSRGEV